ncbi:MAG: hypothetical protein WDW36_002472 [Sanguina aurantia]
MGSWGVKKPGEPATPEKDAKAKKDEKEEMEQIEAGKDLTMDGYVARMKMARMSMRATTPRPRQPPVRMNHHDYPNFIDMMRVSHIRIGQHERIGSIMTQDEKLQVMGSAYNKKTHTWDVLKDKALVERIADRSGVFIDHEVRDCIKSALMSKQDSFRLWRYVEKELKEFMVKLEREDDMQEALAKRDVGGCPMLGKLALISSQTPCDLTGLKYYQCCGALAEDRPEAMKQIAKGGLPCTVSPLQALRGPLGQWKARLSLDKFTSRDEYKFAKMQDQSKKPVFAKDRL